MTSKDTSYTPFDGSLRNQFLVAMPSLRDPNFTNTITYICDHSAEGAMGLIVNKPMDAQLSDVFEQMDVSFLANVGKTPILNGGPVGSQRGFVLHATEGDWESSVRVGPDISLTASRDIVKAIANGDGPTNPQFVLGHAGWSAGQLEQEIKENSWLTVPATSEILFSTPIDQRWAAASRCLGIDINLMSSSVGHA